MRLLRILAVVLGLGLTGLPAWAAGEDVKFETADRVELRGTFYAPTGSGKKAYTVMMLHAVGAKNSSKSEAWQKLAEELQKKGCAVLTFDFRGHGDSTSVDKEFWGHKFNQTLVTGFNAAKPKESIQYKDFKPGYHPYLVNDVMAAKLYLDRRNDAGECNTSKLVIVGAEEGATLGLMWGYAEAYRFMALPNVFPARYETKPQGKDIACCLWLSMSPSLGSKTAPINTWLKQVGVENKTEVAFLYGEEEKTASSLAKDWLKTLKPDMKTKPFTVARGIPKTKLSGQALVSEKLDTIKLITNFVGELAKDDKADNWERREVDKNAYLWRLPASAFPAKLEKQKEINPLPIQALGVAP